MNQRVQLPKKRAREGTRVMSRENNSKKRRKTRRSQGDFTDYDSRSRSRSASQSSSIDDEVGHYFGDRGDLLRGRCKLFFLFLQLS